MDIMNLINSFGLPVAMMIWMMTIGQKTLNELVCSIKEMSKSNLRLRRSIKAMTLSLEKSSQDQTKQILEWMYEQVKDKK